MTTNAVWVRVDPARITDALLKEGVEKVNSAESEAILDFSNVLRIDGTATRALEELAGLAEGRSVKVVLRGVNVGIYRVLKLLKLTRRFSFVT
jgi:anti-anti-sigma regulatory factor